MRHVEAVVLDWAGTVVDFGSFAPTTVFVEAFKRAFDFDISLEEARRPMGLGKRDHIRALGCDADIDTRWRRHFGSAMTEAQVNSLYATFMPLQVAKVAEHAGLIPGAGETLRWLRSQGVRIGSCSGYPRQVMEALLPAAAAQGYAPDHVVASDDLAAGSRPGPWMALANVVALGVGDVAACVKVDDSAPGIHEGLRAGMWTVGLSLSGNESGLTQAQFEAADVATLAKARLHASTQLREAGAHYVIDTIADLPPVLLEIESRRARGERP
ncbi:phosphonoacetaldehyde hydrolase [Stenotrophomonas indicatrix]